MIKQESWPITLLKLALGIGIFFLLLMLYWSSNLVEEDLIAIKNEIQGFKKELRTLTEGVKIQENKDSSLKSSSSHPKNVTLRPHIDPSLPNMLEVDPFEDRYVDILGENFSPNGTFYSATYGKPDTLHPFSNFAEISSWISLCGIYLAKTHIGKYEQMAPYGALKIEERTNKEGKPEFWVHLREDVFWEPLEKRFFPEGFKLSDHFLKRYPVTSEDYKFFFDAVMNPFVQEPGAVAIRTYIDDIVDFEIIDDLTFVVRWKTIKTSDDQIIIRYIARKWTAALRPLASFVFKYFADGKKIVEDDQDKNTYRNSSLWAQNFSQHFAKNVIPSCGAWTFDGFTERSISFKRNPNFFDPHGALANRTEVFFKNSPDTIWQEFKRGSLDTYNLLASQEKEFQDFLESPLYKNQKENDELVNRLSYFQRSFTWVGWNQKNPLFKSKAIRQALTIAIDRRRIIDEILGGKAVEIHGTFFVFSPSTDPNISPWPYDPLLAKRILEQEGFADLDGDGILEGEIDGKRVPFRFSLTYFVKNPTTKATCESIATQLKEIGIDCKLNGVDVTDLSSSIDEKSFDALFLAWGLATPPEDPRQLWHSSEAKKPGSSNAIGFSNKDADRIIERLEYEYNQEKRIELYHQFDRLIHEEQPYTFLYTPEISLLYRNWIHNVFLPLKRQDLIPGAEVAEPNSGLFFTTKKNQSN